MAVLNVQENGNAPSNAQIGDTVITGGGNYQVVAPGTPGASYNPSSGFGLQSLIRLILYQIDK